MPSGGDRVCPLPGGVDAQPQLSGAAGDAGGDVQDAEAEGGDLAACQVGIVGEADGFGPGEEIRCRHDDFEPSGVGVKWVERQLAQPGGFGLADPVFDAGVLAMAWFQPGELPRHHAVGSVGEKPGDVVPVTVGERQLGAGLGT